MIGAQQIHKKAEISWREMGSHEEESDSKMDLQKQTQQKKSRGATAASGGGPNDSDFNGRSVD